MFSNRKREIEQLAEGSRKCGKFENQSGTLVLCFEQAQDTRSSYILEFFPIHDLVGCNNPNKPLPPFYNSDTFMGDKSSVKPIRTLHWDAPSSHIDIPYCCMSFLHTCSSGDELYAVGGLMPDDVDKIYNGIDDQPFFLPSKLTTISLVSGGNKVLPSEVNHKLAAMKSAKFFPLIVEIGGLIYVLSGYPPPLKKKPPSTPEAAQEEGEEYYWFEVYDPQKDAWEQLDDPPFAISDMSFLSSPFVKAGNYRYFVVGNKLHVSDGVFACVYDTESREWKASNLFNQHYLDKKARGLHLINTSTKWELLQESGWGVNCGLGFPFHGQPILVDKEEKIYLCMRKASKGEKTPVTAFQIRGDSIDGEKAVRLPIVLPSGFWPTGHPRKLVDLGQRFFALLMFEEQEDWTVFYATLFTFQLEFEYDDGISTPCRLAASSLRVCYRKSLERRDLYPSYCFRIEV